MIIDKSFSEVFFVEKLDVCLLRLKVYCYYDVNATHAVSFNTRARRSEPYAEDARGELQAEIRVSSGKRSNEGQLRVDGCLPQVWL